MQGHILSTAGDVCWFALIMSVRFSLLRASIIFLVSYICIAGSLTTFISSCVDAEYSFTLKATVKYDVYSYGVVLLELLTGQKVAEAGLGDGVDVVKWVQDKIQSKEPVFKLLDQCLQCLPRPVLQEALEVLGIALLCTHSSPAERPTMKDVVVLLKESRTHRDAVATNCVNE